MNVGVLTSHRGSILQVLIDANVDVALVISNNRDSGALQWAKRHDIPFRHSSGRTRETVASLDIAIPDALCEHDIDLVFFAGYLKKLGPKTLAAFKNRIPNTHPSLLPNIVERECTATGSMRRCSPPGK